MKTIQSNSFDRYMIHPIHLLLYLKWMDLKKHIY
jgi:hypothetical protein